jgi:hypothetical protein
MPTIRNTFITLIAVLLVISTASLLWGDKPTLPLREVKAGAARFQIPGNFSNEERRGTAQSGAVILGEKDERGLCYFQFLGIYWSKSKIADSTLLPAPVYSKDKETASLFPMNGFPDARLTRVWLSAVKPCGHIIREDFRIISFFDTTTKRYYAITGFMRPFLAQDDLAAIAKSIRAHRQSGGAS